MVNDYYITVFETKNQAIFLYSTLETVGYRVFQLVSLPCSIKAGCNYGIKFKDERYIDIIVNEAKALNMEIPEIYFCEKLQGKYKYSKVIIKN
ncbi:DUF3343 domain-containing protein [Tissierella pigra]|uniref:DUF3343 domain-containing protein n=1 Tax=Tissierella pigra TaxID=2607614 RepID=A0A6N7XK69_9FIRM|nr:DUF3343 domain-containing protein [Tissierella pigra]MBU5426717.1 DUF3343 domain-containing protein [Tissierella pigra]MSU02481.1 DUF3343 domain-containing protein [Tissierella pigra]